MCYGNAQLYLHYACKNYFRFTPVQTINVYVKAQLHVQHVDAGSLNEHFTTTTYMYLQKLTFDRELIIPPSRLVKPDVSVFAYDS